MVVVTLLFMFYLSWRLSLVAFISVPAIVTVSKMYGNYIRKLSKLSQVYAVVWYIGYVYLTRFSLVGSEWCTHTPVHGLYPPCSCL